MEGEKPVIFRITLEAIKQGPCEGCGQPAVRSKTFSGDTARAAQDKLDDWEGQPLFHQRCEP